MITGAQCFTVRDFTQTEKDIRRALKRLAAIGYKTIQVSAFGKIEPKVLREICDENGLSIVLTHTDPNRILYDTEAVIAEHDCLGCDYIGLGAMPDRYRSPAWIQYFAEDYLPAAQKIAKAGKLMMYHNHAFEWQKLPDGSRIIERLAQDFAPNELGFTLDTYWVQAAGGDVCQWIETLSGRLPCVHLKDMAVISGSPVMAPVGEGNLNFPKILKTLERAGTKYILVEQDVCVQDTPFACLQTSFENLKKMGY